MKYTDYKEETQEITIHNVYNLLLDIENRRSSLSKL